MIASVPGKSSAQALAEEHFPGTFAYASENLHLTGNENAAALSFAQQRLWSGLEIQPHDPAYNGTVLIERTGALDLLALENSLSEIIRRHELWRTGFTSVNGQVKQLVQAPKAVHLPVVDLRGFPTSEKESELSRLITQDARRPFQLSEGPLLRSKLVQLDDEKYVLFFTLQALIADRECIYRVLLPELSALYEAFSRGEHPDLPSLPIQYADFARRERTSGSDHWQEDFAYWRQQVSGELPRVGLPTDRPQLAGKRICASRPFPVPRELTEQLRDSSNLENYSGGAFLLAAFAAFLHRYTQQDEILLGWLKNTHEDPETERLLGRFENILVVRISVSGNPKVQELLTQVHEVISAAVEHENLPFEVMMQELRGNATSEPHGLLSSTFSYNPLLPAELRGWKLRPPSFENSIRSELHFETDATSEGLIGRFTYNADVFDEATVARMVKHFQLLLYDMSARPAKHISELKLLSTAERDQAISGWNDTDQEYPREQCVHQLIEASVDRFPDETAVICEGARLTYSELNRRANQLARYLRKLGVGPDVLVGVFIGRTPEMLVGLLGILKAGGAYVPLDPAYPEERLAFVSQDAGLQLLLTCEALASRFANSAQRVIKLDADWPEIARESADNLQRTSTAHNLAYVIYTSGSTGKPKGVQVPHRALVNFLVSMANAPGFMQHDRLLAVTTLSFDIASLELFLPLAVGGSLEIASRTVASDGSALAAMLTASGTTVMQATPATWRLLLESGWTGNSQLKILCGGEALSRELADELLARCASLWNMYGPTETTVWSAARKIAAGSGPISIGRPIANTQIYVLDRYLNPAPIGVTGELYIGGDGLARGYLGRPELTAEKFVSNHFSRGSGARLYKTGDLARYLPNGEIEFLGRADYQVKIRGFRVELGEVEAALFRHPKIKAAAVNCEPTHQENTLVAYVVGSPGSEPSAGQLHSHLKRILPSYMLPSRFVFVKTLPLTPNGKVDRNSLHLAPLLESKIASCGLEARSLLENQMLAIWEELLESRPIGVHDDFFESGGNSLLAVRLMRRIEQVCGRKLPLSTLFAGATVEHLAKAVLEGGRQWAAGAPLIEVQAGSRQPFFFCHGDYSGGSYCRRLAARLGPEQGFYAISPHGLDGDAVPSTIEAMAADRLQTLLRHRPNGPYLIGGYSNGALVAFEMARQMQKTGRNADLLVLVDTAASNVRLEWPRRLLSWTGPLLRLDNDAQAALLLRYRAFFDALAKSSETGLRGQVSFLASKLRRNGTNAAFSAQEQPAGVPAAQDRELRDKLLACIRAMDCYVPRPYAGRIILLRTCVLSSLPSDSTAGWGRVAKQVEVRWMPGDHRGCVTENLDIFAEHLVSCLRSVQSLLPIAAG